MSDIGLRYCSAIFQAILSCCIVLQYQVERLRCILQPDLGEWGGRYTRERKKEGNEEEKRNTESESYGADNIDILIAYCIIGSTKGCLKTYALVSPPNLSLVSPV